MFKCDICNRIIKKKNSLQGYCLCSKHMHQLYTYGKFLDNNPRTQNDLNDFRIEGNSVIFDLYDEKQFKNNEFIIDLEDLEKVRYHKWRLSYGHVVTGNCTKNNPTIQLGRLIMNCYDPSFVVDHRDGNGLENRKFNLRICTQSNNVLNKSFMSNNTTGFVGIYPDTRSGRKTKFRAEIRFQEKRFHIGAWETLAEAVYARWIAELILFGAYRNTNDDNARHQLIESLPQGRKIQISNYISEKIKSKL